MSGISRASISDTATTAVHFCNQLSAICHHQFLIMGKLSVWSYVSISMFFSLCQNASFCCILIFNYFVYCLVVYKEKEKAKEISRVSISDMQ
jgi:hypothetical protein